MDLELVETPKKEPMELLYLYKMFKENFRKLTRQELDQFMGCGSDLKGLTSKICSEFIAAKHLPEDLEKNTSYLTFPKFFPLVALISESSDDKKIPHLVRQLQFQLVPKRFRDKFSYLLVYGFWYVGKLIIASLSEKPEINLGNPFNFLPGDLGYWWAGVHILDWTQSVNKGGPQFYVGCKEFIKLNHPSYRFYSGRAILNLGNQCISEFLTRDDWCNHDETISTIRHYKVHGRVKVMPETMMDWE